MRDMTEIIEILNKIGIPLSEAERFADTSREAILCELAVLGIISPLFLLKSQKFNQQYEAIYQEMLNRCGDENQFLMKIHKLLAMTLYSEGVPQNIGGEKQINFVCDSICNIVKSLGFSQDEAKYFTTGFVEMLYNTVKLTSEELANQILLENNIGGNA